MSAPKEWNKEREFWCFFPQIERKRASALEKKTKKKEKKKASVFLISERVMQPFVQCMS